MSTTHAEARVRSPGTRPLRNPCDGEGDAAVLSFIQEPGYGAAGGLTIRRGNPGYELAAGTGSGAGAGSGVYCPLARALWPPSAMTALAVTRW